MAWEECIKRHLLAFGKERHLMDSKFYEEFETALQRSKGTWENENVWVTHIAFCGLKQTTTKYWSVICS